MSPRVEPAVPSEIPPPAPRVAAGAWASALAQHPRLLGPAGYVPRRAQLLPRLYEAIRGDDTIGRPDAIREVMRADTARHSFEIFQTAAFAAGIVRQVEGLPEAWIEPFVAAARERAARGVANEHQNSWVWMTDVALVYDLFHDRLSAQDRQQSIAWLNPHLETFTDDENPFHNSCLSKIQCYLRVAYATWGENPRAGEFRDYALKKLYEGLVAPVLAELGAGGGWTECGWYQQHSVWHLVEALELARRVEGYDGFQLAPRFFYQRMAYDLAQSLPTPRADGTARLPHEGDGGDAYWWGTESVRHTRTLLAQYFRGSELARCVASQRPAGPLAPARIPNFLYEEEPEEPLPLETLPTAHLAAGVGKVYARSDWSPEATWFRFECGPFFCAHQHYDVGHFEVFRHEPLLTESGEYLWGGPHALNWYIRTIAHNSVLVYRPGETWTRMRDGGRTAIENDGGQAKKWDWVQYSLEQWKAHPEYRRGAIVAYDNQSESLYLAADCTGAYDPAKLAQWTRQIVFLRPHTFVVFDRVVSTKPEYEKTWLLHMCNEPEVSGRAVMVTNGPGRLSVQTLLPEAATLEKVYGYGYRGLDFDGPRNHHNDTSNRWRVEVRPAAAQTEDLFLHVLSTEGRPDVGVLREGEVVGARVGDAEVRFRGLGGELLLEGRRRVLAPGVKCGRLER